MLPGPVAAPNGGSIVATTAVAIDKDKNSQDVVRWAIDNLKTANNSLILVHVVNKNALNNMSGGAARELLEAEITNLFLSYKGLRATRTVQLTMEVVLEDTDIATDIAKALIEFINSRNIKNLVLGTSRNYSILKKLKNPDIPTRMVKHAPDFCAVYVINKEGKLVSAKIP